jgi:gamma-tubulin complex component 6
MSHFIQVLENHITRSAFQASWKRFLEDLKTARNMEDLYRKHASYLKRVLFLCLLNKNSAEYSKNVEEIFKVILKFHK